VGFFLAQKPLEMMHFLLNDLKINSLLVVGLMQLLLWNSFESNGF
jgi:hypothetical protein